MKLVKILGNGANVHTFYGVLFGLTFPLIGILILVFSNSLEFSFDTIVKLHKTNPLLWIIETAPLFLGVLARFGGLKQDVLFHKFRYLGDKHKSTQIELADSKDQIEYSSCSLQLYDEKYLHLIEESEEIIFSFDEDMICLSVNKSVKSHMGLKPELVVGKKFFDLLYKRKNEIDSSNDYIEKLIEDFLRDKKPISFIAEFVSPIKSESLEMQVKMNFFDVDGRTEIIARVLSIVDDKLLKFFVYESRKIEMDNSLLHAEEMSRRLTKNLVKYVDRDDIVPIKVIIREMLLNAIEHGNLNISYQEKSDAMFNNRYFDFIEERLLDSKYSERKILIEYEITSDLISFRITDNGDGFDHESFLDKIRTKQIDYLELQWLLKYLIKLSIMRRAIVFF